MRITKETVVFQYLCYTKATCYRLHPKDGESTVSTGVCLSTGGTPPSGPGSLPSLWSRVLSWGRDTPASSSRSLPILWSHVLSRGTAVPARGYPRTRAEFDLCRLGICHSSQGHTAIHKRYSSKGSAQNSFLSVLYGKLHLYILTPVFHFGHKGRILINVEITKGHTFCIVVEVRKLSVSPNSLNPEIDHIFSLCANSNSSTTPPHPVSESKTST